MNANRNDIMGLVLSWGGVALLGYLAYLVVRPFLNPLGWAAVFAIFAYPVHFRLERRWNATGAAALTTAAVAILLIGPMLAVLIAFVREAIETAAAVQRAFAEGRLAWVERAWNELQLRVPTVQGVDLGTILPAAAERGASFVVAQSGSVLRNVARFLGDLTIALFATFFLLRDWRTIVRVIRRLLPGDEATREALMSRTRELISVGVASSLLVAGLQGLLGGVIFALVGLHAPVFWGVVMAVCCLLPFGAWIVWLPAAVLLGASGAVVRAIVLAALGIGVVSAADNVLRPMLLAGRAGMNGLVIFVSLIGGMSVFGLLGLILGPTLVVTALGLLTAYVGSPRT
jgi:predicted PurR-regulated permease PerM